MGLAANLFVSGQPAADQVKQICAADVGTCRVLLGHARMGGAGPALLSIMPVLVQLVLAEGLRRGRRAAWLGAVLFTGILTAVGAVVVAVVLQDPGAALSVLHTTRAGLPLVALWSPVAAPAAVLVLLLATRNRFPVRPPAARPAGGSRWPRSASGWSWSSTSAPGCSCAVTGSSRPRWPGCSPTCPPACCPPGLAGRGAAPGRAAARGRPRAGQLDRGRVLVGAGGHRLGGRAAGGAAGRRRPARALVDRWGEGALSFMTTWVGNRWWFTADGRAVVAFRVVGGVALTTGDPVGPPDARVAAVTEFTAWCEARGWTPAGTRSPRRSPTRCRAGAGCRWPARPGSRWASSPTPEEVAGRPDGDQPGRPRRRAGGLAALGRRAAAPARAGRPLVGGVAGRQGPARDGLHPRRARRAGRPRRPVPAVGRPDGRVHGITSWLPATRDGVRVGWTLDLMRRSPGCPPGTMEFLVGTAALTFQEEGCEFVSLSGAPLAFPRRRRRQRRAGPAAGGHRPADGAGLRVPFAAGLQGQVPAPAPAPVAGAPRPGRPAPDRPRRVAGLPAAPVAGRGGAAGSGAVAGRRRPGRARPRRGWGPAGARRRPGAPAPRGRGPAGAPRGRPVPPRSSTRVPDEPARCGRGCAPARGGAGRRVPVGDAAGERCGQQHDERRPGPHGRGGRRLDHRGRQPRLRRR